MPPSPRISQSGIDRDQNELYANRAQLRQDTSELQQEIAERLRAANLAEPERDHLNTGMEAVNNLIQLQAYRDRTPGQWAQQDAATAQQDDATFAYLRQTEMRDRGDVVDFLRAENTVYRQMITNATATRTAADDDIKRASAAMQQASEHPAKAAADLQRATGRLQSAQAALAPYQGREHEFRRDRNYNKLVETYNRRVNSYTAAQADVADSAHATTRYNAAKALFDSAKVRYDAADERITDAEENRDANKEIADRITRVGSLEDKLGRNYDTLGNALMADTKRKHKWSANQLRSIKESGGQSIARLREVRSDQYHYLPNGQPRAQSLLQSMAITGALSEKYQTANCGENANWQAIEAMYRFNRANIPIGIKSHDADHALFTMGRFGYREMRVQDTWPPDSDRSINIQRYNLTTLHRQRDQFTAVTNSPFDYLKHAKENLIPDAPEARAYFGSIKPFKHSADATAWVRNNEYPYRSHLYNITRAEHGDGNNSDATGVTITSDRLRTAMTSPPMSSSEQYASNSNSNSNGGWPGPGMPGLSRDMDRLSMSHSSDSPSLTGGARGFAYTALPVTSPSNSGYNASSEQSSSGRGTSDRSSPSSGGDSDRERRSDAPSPTSSTTSMRLNPASQYASMPSSSSLPQTSQPPPDRAHGQQRPKGKAPARKG